MSKVADNSNSTVNPEAEVAGDEQKGKKRLIYWIYWHRTWIIWIIALSHAIDKANEVTQESIKNPVFKTFRENFFRNALQYGMPFLYMFSGMTNSFYNGDRPWAYLKFLKGKVVGLAVPFCFAILFMQLPKQYFSQGWFIKYREDPDKPNWDFASYTDFWLKKCHFTTRIEYLWFLPAIFLAYLNTYPATQFIRRRGKKMPLELHDLMLFLGIPITMFFFAHGCFKIVNPDFVEPYFKPTFIISTIGHMVFCISAYIAQKYENCAGLSIFYWLALVFQIALVHYHPGNTKITMFGLLMQNEYFSLVQLQGTFNYCMHDQIVKDWHSIKKSKAFIVVATVWLYSVGFLWNSSERDVGIVVLYPFYFDVNARIMKVIGTWILIYMGTFLMSTRADEQYNTGLFKIINGSSMWFYLSHPFWQNMAMSVIYQYELTYWPLLLSICSFTTVMVLLTYVPISKLGLI